MNDTPHPLLTWRAPDWRTGVGIALGVLGLSCLVVFALSGLLLDHTPRTADVPTNGSIGGAACMVIGLALWASVPRITVDVDGGVIRRGSETIAELSKTCAVLQQEVLQVYVGTSGGQMETRSWSLVLIQDHLDEAAITAKFAGKPRPDDVEVVTLMRGVPKGSVTRIGGPLAERLGVLCVTLDAEGKLRAANGLE